MNERSYNMSSALAWLVGTAALAYKVPHAKLAELIGGAFSGKQAVLTSWVSNLAKLFATKKATITAWTGYLQMGLFLLVVIGVIFAMWKLTWSFHVYRRDSDEMGQEQGSGAAIDGLAAGAIASIATILSMELIFALSSTGKTGTLRAYVYGLAKGTMESMVLLGFFGILALVAVILIANRNVRTLFFKELRIYFTTPIAYVVMMLFSVIAGYFFSLAFANFQRYSMMYQIRYRQMAQFNLNDLVFTQVLNVFGVILLFLVPILTMRLLAEEKRNRTFELLMTAPISSTEIVMGKYLSVLAALAALLGLTFAYPLMVNVVSPGSFEWGPIFTGYLGMYILSAALAAVGLVCSSLTENQIIAAVLSFGILLLLWVIESAAGRLSDGPLREIVAHLSILAHLKGFVRGVVEVKDVVYYLSLIFFANFLTQRVIESQRWK